MKLLEKFSKKCSELRMKKYIARRDKTEKKYYCDELFIKRTAELKEYYDEFLNLPIEKQREFIELCNNYDFEQIDKRLLNAHHSLKQH